MKATITFIFLALISSNLIAQPWMPGASGSIYYNSGNVGVGTNTPLYKTVISNNGAAGLEIDPAGGQFAGGVGIQSYNRTTSAYVPMQIYGSKLILWGGNVGIGISDPDMKLSVYAGGEFVARFHSTGSQSITGLRIGRTSSYADLINTTSGFGIAAGVSSAQLPLDSQNPNQLHLFLQNTTGNIGMGTANPLYRTVISNNGGIGIEFDPAGGQLVGGAGIQAYNRATSAYVPFQLYGSKVLLNGGYVGVGTVNPLYKTVISNNGGIGIEFDPEGIQLTGGAGIQAYNRATSTYVPFQLYGSKILLNGGNVLIGKTTQDNSSYRVDVDGKIRSQEIVVNADGSDFVFESDYELQNLEEVEQFIKDNKHLPGIEPAKEMRENGLELGKMDMKLLQKVEELTLYMIDFKKQMDTVRQENRKLKEEIAQLKKH